MKTCSLALLLAVSACAGTTLPQPRAAEPAGFAAARSSRPSAAPQRPRTFIQRLAAVSRALEAEFTPETVGDIFEAAVERTEAAHMFRIVLPDDGGTIWIDLPTPESPQRAVRIADVPKLRFAHLTALYGKHYEVMRGTKEGPLVIFDAAQSSWPYGLYVSARLVGSARPRARVRYLELHHPQPVEAPMEEVPAEDAAAEERSGDD